MNCHYCCHILAACSCLANEAFATPRSVGLTDLQVLQICRNSVFLKEVKSVFMIRSEMMRRSLAVCLPLIILIAGLSTTAVARKTEITFLYQGEASEIGQGSFTDRIIKSFQQKYPNISVKINANTGGAAYYDKLLSMMAGGVMSDVFYCDPNQFYIFGLNGLAEDLKPYLRASSYDPLNPQKYVQTALKLATFNGRILASTPHGGMMTWYWNKDLFAQAGLAPPPASYDAPGYRSWTWDVLEQTGRKLEALNSGNRKVMGVSVAPWFMNYYNWIRLAGGSIYDSNVSPTMSALDSKEAIQALSWLQEVNQRKTVNLTYSAFTQGKLALCNDGAWAVADYKRFNKNKGLPFNWDITVYPYNPRFPERKGTIWYQDGFMLYKGSKKKTEASKFLMYMLFDPEAQKIAAEEGVGIPLMHSENASKHYLSNMPEGAASWGKTLDSYAAFEPSVKNQDKIWTALDSVFSQLTGNKKSAAQIAREAADRVNVLLRKK